MMIYTAASGAYVGYAEIWKYCVSRAYPDCQVRCDILHDARTPYYAACYRLLYNPDETQDYIYVTDVDMIILREQPTLKEFHLKEMRQSGLCYSNTRRKKEVMGDKRITGLHFASQEWYAKTKNVRALYMHAIDNGEFGNGRFDDELILNQIMVKCKMAIPVISALVKRHHGIHLGTVRAYINHPAAKLKQQLRMRITKKQSEQFVILFEEHAFRSLVIRAAPVIRHEMMTVYAFCKRMLNG